MDTVRKSSRIAAFVAAALNGRGKKPLASGPTTTANHSRRTGILAAKRAAKKRRNQLRNRMAIKAARSRA